MPRATQALPADATVAHYQRDGAVVLRQVLDAGQVARLAQGIEHNLAHPSPLALVASQPDDPGRFVEDFCTWQDNPAYRDILFDSALPEAAARLMASHQVAHLLDSASIVDGIAKGLKHPDWPHGPWEALRRWVLAMLQISATGSAPGGGRGKLRLALQP